MDLKEYTPLALSTALPTAFSKEYLLPAIYGEVGEVIEKYGKAHRDGKSREWLEYELAKELGDVCWATAILLHMAEVTEEEIPRGSYYLIEDEQLSKLSSISGQMFRDHWRKGDPTYLHPYLVQDAKRLWAELRDIAPLITGRSFSDVLQMNVDKLASRQQRGVIAGSGDNR